MYGSILLVLSANDAVLWWRMIYFPILVAVWQVLVQVGDGSGQVRSGQVRVMVVVVMHPREVLSTIHDTLLVKGPFPRMSYRVIPYIRSTAMTGSAE